MGAYQLGLYEKSMPDELSIPEKLSAAREAGYDFLELSIDESPEKLARLNWSREERQALCGQIWAAGLPVRSICLSGHRKYPLGHLDPAVRQASLSILERAVGLAADLGVRVIQLAGYDVYYEESSAETRANFERSLRLCVEMAAEEGVILAFETMETEFLNTVGKAMKWVRRMNSPYLQVYPDAGNITNAAVRTGGDVLEDLRTGAGHLAALHLKETVPGVFREVAYGTGHVDFAAMTREAYRLGVRRYLAEFWYQGQPDWRKTLAENGCFLRGYLDRAVKQKALTVSPVG